MATAKYTDEKKQKEKEVAGLKAQAAKLKKEAEAELKKAGNMK